MEICKSCDHNVIIECAGGCFFPHNTPPCFRQVMASQTSRESSKREESANMPRDEIRLLAESIVSCINEGQYDNAKILAESIIAELLPVA